VFSDSKDDEWIQCHLPSDERSRIHIEGNMLNVTNINDPTDEDSAQRGSPINHRYYYRGPFGKKIDKQFCRFLFEMIIAVLLFFYCLLMIALKKDDNGIFQNLLFMIMGIIFPSPTRLINKRDNSNSQSTE